MKKLFLLFIITLFYSSESFSQLLEVNVPCATPADYQGGDADYVPGVDVNGNAVAPADVTAPIEALNYPIRIPVELDILRFLDIDLPDSARDAINIDEANIVHFELFEDGSIKYNGQDLSDKVSQVCDDGREKFEQPSLKSILQSDKAIGKSEKSGGHKNSELLVSEQPDGEDGEKIDGQYP